MKKIVVTLLTLALLLLAGCAKETDGKDKETDTTTDTEQEDSDYLTEIDTMSEGAQKIIETFLTGPNPDFFNEDMITSIGLEKEPTEEELQKVQEASDAALAKLEEAVGEYFAPDGLQTFLNNGAGYSYLALGQEVTVKDMELIKRTKSIEQVKVTVLVDGAEEETNITLRYNEDGLIWKAELIQP